MKRNSLFKRITAVFLILSMLLLAGCGQGTGTNDPAAGSAAGEEAAPQTKAGTGGSLPVISMNKFKSAVSGFGEVQDMTEDYGFDACMVREEDGNVYIYMFMPTEEMADQLITDADGDGQADPGLEILKSGDNFAYYRQSGETDQQGIPISEYALRVENMLILVSGGSDRETAIKEQTEKLLKTLGYKEIG